MRLRTCCSLLLALCVAAFAVPTCAQQRVIYDDDCSQDVDCVATLPILYKLADRGEIRVLATIADSANPLTAPVLRIFARLGGHGETPIGANQSDDPATALCAKGKCNQSDWAAQVVARFDAGDTRANYPDCVAVYRRALAGEPEHSVAIVETGFATCLNQLLASGPDAASPLSGAELVKCKVRLLSIMGGRYPAGSEWNFRSDAEGYHALFLKWTRQNGYPAIYLNGYANGEHVMAGPPASSRPETDPTRYAMDLCHVTQRPMWDMLSLLFAARGTAYQGTAYFTVSKPGTVAVNVTTGDDVWSDAVDSGQYVITNAAPDETFSALFDGYAHTTGLLAEAAPR